MEQLKAPWSLSLPPALTMCRCNRVSCAAAFLLLLLLSGSALQCLAAPLTGELRCQCITVSEAVMRRRIASVLLIPEGPHCDVSEVIATLKNGQKTCLNPTTDWVKLVIRRIIEDATSEIVPRG